MPLKVEKDGTRRRLTIIRRRGKNQMVAIASIMTDKADPVKQRSDTLLFLEKHLKVK